MSEQDRMMTNDETVAAIHKQRQARCNADEEHFMIQGACWYCNRTQQDIDDRRESEPRRCRVSDTYEPAGTRFYDIAGQRSMLLVSEHEPREDLRGWLLWRHPDGQWVTLRKATDDDLARVRQDFASPLDDARPLPEWMRAKEVRGET